MTALFGGEAGGGNQSRFEVESRRHGKVSGRGGEGAREESSGEDRVDLAFCPVGIHCETDKDEECNARAELVTEWFEKKSRELYRTQVCGLPAMHECLQ